MLLKVLYQSTIHTYKSVYYYVGLIHVSIEINAII